MAAVEKDIKNSGEEKPSDQEQIQKLIGLGEFSARKSYYPELQKKVKELEDEKEKYERIFTNASNGIFQANFSGEILVANPAMAELLGYISQADLIESVNLSQNLIMDIGDREKLFKELRINQSVIGFETKLIRKDSRLVTVLINASLTSSSSGEYIEGFVQDISQRKQMEEDLRKNEENLRTTLNSIGDAVIATNLSCQIVRMNPQAEKLTGWKYSEAEGRELEDVFNIINVETGEKINNPLSIVLGKDPELVLPPNVLLFSKDDQQYQISFSLSPIKDEKNNISGVVLVFRDVTQEFEMQELLQVNKERLDLALEVANEGLWDWNMEEDTFYFDPRYYKMAGYEPDEFPHDFIEWANRVHPDDINAAMDTINDYVLKGQGSYDTEFRFLKKDGSWMWISSRGRIITWDKDGKPLRMLGTHTDITERKNSEINLRLKDFIIHSAPIAISTADLNGKLTYANPEFLRIWGFSGLDEVLDTFFHDLWITEEYKDSISRDLSGEKRYWMADVQARRKDRSLFDVQLFIARIFDKNGNTLGYMQTSVDITERKQVMEALEKRIIALTRPLSDPKNILFEELFNLEDIQKLQDEFAKATGVASIITYPDGRPITTPSNFCRLCNDIIRKTEKGLQNCYRSDAALGQFHPEKPIVKPCLSGGLWDAGTSISIGGKHIANWLIGQVRDDTQNEEKIRSYARKIGADEEQAAKAFNEVPSMSREQFDQVAQLVYTLAQQLSNIAYQNVQQARFIMDRKRDEEDLRQLRNYLSNIINSMPSILIGVDRSGKVTQWNSEAQHEMGISSENAIGQPVEEVFPRLASEMGRIRQAMKTQQVLSELKKVRQGEGETRFEDMTIYPLISNGVEGAVIRIDNVTERVRIEEMMVQSEKMLSVGGLAAGMAHEINNPLAGMIQTANVLINRLDTNRKIPANQRAAEELGISMEDIHAFMEKRDVPRMLTAIHESGKRVADIVQNMLSFSRKSEALISTHYMDELLDKTLELAATDYDLKKHYDFRKIEIIREYEENLPGIPCEAAKIQQVLLNILRNGAEAMQESDTIEPRFVLRAMYEREQKFVRIEVEDNGPGMEEAVRKRVFEPFFTTKPPGVGTGLGLSVSYFIIVENHHGEIFVESQPGEGTKFVIRLPQERKIHEEI